MRLRVSWTEGSSKQEYSIRRNFPRISSVRPLLSARRREISRKFITAVRQEVKTMVKSRRSIHGREAENKAHPEKPADRDAPARSIICWVHTRERGVQTAERIKDPVYSAAGPPAHRNRRATDWSPRRITTNLSFFMAKHILHWRFLTNFLDASIKRTFV